MYSINGESLRSVQDGKGVLERLAAEAAGSLRAAGSDASRVATAAVEGAAGLAQHRTAVGCAARVAAAAQKKSLHAQEQDTPENRERSASVARRRRGADNGSPDG